MFAWIVISLAFVICDANIIILILQHIIQVSYNKLSMFCSADESLSPSTHLHDLFVSLVFKRCLLLDVLHNQTK